MATQFWINHYCVDLKRNQICHQEYKATLPPKALAVLKILAENVGQVVSHDEIMDEVWANSVVAPNTLQRNIAQLRKAFGDDSKQQNFIQTHSKQGYSLTANVKWHESEGTLSFTQTTAEKQTRLSHLNPFVMVSVVAVVVIAAWFFFDGQSNEHVFTQYQPLTASDEREFGATFSPDGKMLVFHRFEQGCNSHIWAKDLASQREYRLTETATKYGQHNWSEDGNQLVFSVRDRCNVSVNKEDICWSIHTLDVVAGLKNPQPTTQRLNCEGKKTGLARWLPHGSIGYLKEMATNENALYSFAPRENKETLIFETNNGRLYSYDYSFLENEFAVIIRTDDNRHLVVLLDDKGKVLSENEIQRENKHSFYEFYNVRFHPSGEYLVTQLETGLYSLSFEGELTRVNSLDTRNLFSPYFHPSGKQVVASVANVDKDIAVIDINKPINAVSNDQQLESIFRSNESELNGKLHKESGKVAFVSNQSGKHQIWYDLDGQASQLTRFEEGIATTSIHWSPDGKKLLTIVADKLVAIDLAGNLEFIGTELPIFEVFQWTSDNTLLVNAVDQNTLSFFQIDLNDAVPTMKKLALPSNIQWLQITANDTLVYVDDKQQFWQKSGQSAEKISQLFAKLNKPIFVVDGEAIWGINTNDELWRFQLESGLLETVATLPPSSINVSDVQGDQVFIEQVIQAKKELVAMK